MGQGAVWRCHAPSLVVSPLNEAGGVIAEEETLDFPRGVPQPLITPCACSAHTRCEDVRHAPQVGCFRILFFFSGSVVRMLCSRHASPDQP